MTKLDSIPPSLTYPTVSHFDRGSVSRLIVLIPASADDSPNLSHRIWEIAKSSGLNVLLLSLCTDSGEEPHLRRTLVTTAAIVKDIDISTEVMIERGNDWVGLARHIYRPGDVIACYAGQRVGLMHKFLHEVLRSQLQAPIYILSDDRPIKSFGSSLLSQALFWIGTLAIIGGFLWIEMKIVELAQDWAHTSLLYVCIFIELALIWLWNSIFTPSQ